MRVIGKVIAMEIGLYRSLWRRITRRTDVPPGSAGFAYVGTVSVLLWGFIMVSAMELVALHLLLPWPTVRFAADILSVWGLAWMLGLLASYTVYPHLVDPDLLRVRRGITPEIVVPWRAVATIAVRERSREKSRALQVDHESDKTVLNVVTASRTNIDVRLREPVTMNVRGEEITVTELRFLADNPASLVKHANSLMPESNRRLTTA